MALVEESQTGTGQLHGFTGPLACSAGNRHVFVITDRDDIRAIKRKDTHRARKTSPALVQFIAEPETIIYYYNNTRIRINKNIIIMMIIINNDVF